MKIWNEDGTWRYAEILKLIKMVENILMVYVTFSVPYRLFQDSFEKGDQM